MALRLLRLRTRSPERDRQNDLRKFDNVRASLDDAVAATKREIDGLERRIQETLERATWMLDSSGDYGERSPEDEKGISDLEGQAMRGRQRLATLRLHLDAFERIIATLDEVTAEVAPGGAEDAPAAAKPD